MGKIGAVLISHGSLANELLHAAEIVVGDVSHIAAVSIGWNDDVEDAKSRIASAIDAVGAGQGVLLLTDMFGGTPTNIAAMFIEDGQIEVITGMNLPMVVKIASHNRDSDLKEFAVEVESQGKNSIYRAGALVAPKSTR